MDRAVAVVRGQILGTTIGSVRNPTTGITIPETFAAGGLYAGCYAFHDNVPASCAAPLPHAPAPVRTRTYVGRYPPFYYLVVGLPSLFAVSETGVYLMRLLSDLVNALLIALALTSVAAWSRHRVGFLAVLVAITPMVWFMGSVVNPNGLEICSAVCLWTAGMVLALEHADDPPRGLVAIAAVSLCALLLSRPLSPLWAVIILGVLALAAGGRSVCALASSRAVRWSIAPIAACGAVAVAWILSVHSLDLKPTGAPVPPGHDVVRLLGAVFGQMGTWLRQMVGVFGWLDTSSPVLTYVIWGCLVALFGFAALTLSRRRRLGAYILLVLGAVLVPVAVVASQAYRLGIDWQGRYTLPIAVGVVLLPVAIVESPAAVSRRRVLSGLVCFAVLVADAGAYLYAMRRYAVGATGPIDFLNGKWHPPLGILPVALGGCILVTLLTAWVFLHAGVLARFHRAAPSEGGCSQ